MTEFSKCENCYKKCTTTGCLECKTYKINGAINELGEFLEGNKSNLSNFILYINILYYPQILKASNLNLSQIEHRLNSSLENNTVFVIVDKSAFNWRDFYIEGEYYE